MKNETNAQYVNRAALNTVIWLDDRSANCHPIIFINIKKVEVMIGEFLVDKKSPSSATQIKKLSKANRAIVQARLAGFIWAQLERKESE